MFQRICVLAVEARSKKIIYNGEADNKKMGTQSVTVLIGKSNLPFPQDLKGTKKTGGTGCYSLRARQIVIATDPGLTRRLERVETFEGKGWP